MNKDNEDAPSDPPPAAADDRAVQYRWDGETTPSIAVVEAVAATTGREPTALPPLMNAVDADALDELFTGDGDGLLQLTFEYAGTTVVLYRNGRVVVFPP